jgi:hypothetical protein
MARSKYLTFSDPSHITIGDLAEVLGAAMDRCGGKFHITHAPQESFITHWERTGLYGVEVPKNVALGTLPEVLAGLERYVSAYKRPRTHEEGATELVLEDRA